MAIICLQFLLIEQKAQYHTKTQVVTLLTILVCLFDCQLSCQQLDRGNAPPDPYNGPLSNNDAGPHECPVGTDEGLRALKFEPAHPAGLLAITSNYRTEYGGTLVMFWAFQQQQCHQEAEGILCFSLLSNLKHFSQNRPAAPLCVIKEVKRLSDLEEKKSSGGVLASAGSTVFQVVNLRRGELYPEHAWHVGVLVICQQQKSLS